MHRKLIIYNLFPLSEGNISDWIRKIKYIKKLNFNTIYINPFHYPGFSGSLYAPKFYYKINPLFLDNNLNLSEFDQLKLFVDEAKKNDISVIMDLVINHTSIDNPLTKEKKQWYKFENGKIKHPGCDQDGQYIQWGDLAEIDNANSPDRENLWKYWLNLCEFYINIGFEGFRCDAAYQVPTELWKYLFQNIKSKNENIIFLAETLGCPIEKTEELIDAGFDYIFSSLKWWNLKEEWFFEQQHNLYHKTKTIAFPESHDTIRFAKEHNCNKNKALLWYVLCSAFSSGVMCLSGFEYGFTQKTDVVKLQNPDELQKNYDLTEEIKNINSVKLEYLDFAHDEKIFPLNHLSPPLYGFFKYFSKGAIRLFILFNYSDKEIIFDFNDYPLFSVINNYEILYPGKNICLNKNEKIQLPGYSIYLLKI